MKAVALAVLVACASPESHALHATVHDPAPSNELPLPPHQRDRWTPGAGLSPALAAAVATLFDDGLADPRGLDYREVELAIGSADATAAIVARTHAWVFDAERFAVAWNGLVYPVLHTGRAADLGADVARLGKPAGSAWTEADGVASDTPHVLKVAMLARLGEDRVATAMWAAMTEPFPTLATKWAYALCDRAIAAHVRGDHAMVLASAIVAMRAQAAILADATRRGVEVRLEGLAVLPRLIADDGHPRVVRPLPDKRVLAAMPGADRVALLIDHLGEIRMQFYDGGISDPVVVPALREVGTPAVDALTAVIDADPRLTHSVFGQDAVGHLEILGVEIAADEAVSKILERLFFGTGDPAIEERKRVAAEIRAYWAKWRDVPIEERWYRQLADDAEDPHVQLTAAQLLVQPAATGLRGDALRTHAPPSVSELLDKRIAATADIHAACYMVEAYDRWDPASAHAALANVMARAIADSGTTGKWGSCITDLAKARDDAGDPHGIDEYARWLEHTQPDMLPMLMFTLAAERMTTPSVVHAIDVLFRDGSPWVPLVDPTSAIDSTELVGMPLIHMAPFNKQVLAGLADTRVAGTLEMTKAREFWFKPNHEGGGLIASIEEHAPFVPPVGTHQPVRVCDWIAYALQIHTGVPRFELFWSERQRDDAIAVMRGWLKGQVKP